MAEGRTEEKLGGKKSRGACVKPLAVWPAMTARAPFHPPCLLGRIK